MPQHSAIGNVTMSTDCSDPFGNRQAARFASARSAATGSRSTPIVGPRTAKAIKSPPIPQQRSAIDRTAVKRPPVNRSALYPAIASSVACSSPSGVKNNRAAAANFSRARCRSAACWSTRWTRSADSSLRNFAIDADARLQLFCRRFQPRSGLRAQQPMEIGQRTRFSHGLSAADWENGRMTWAKFDRFRPDVYY